MVDFQPVEDDWDGYGGKATDPVAYRRMLRFMAALESMLDPEQMPALVPTSNGTILAEWSEPELIVEFCAQPATPAELTYWPSSAEILGHWPGHVGLVCAVARALDSVRPVAQ